MVNETPRKGRFRVTRRGGIALIVIGVLAVVAAVVVPLTLSGDEERPTALTVPEGRRASQVYEAVDKALGLPADSTKKAVPKADLKLPAEAKGNPEGYLFPATYPLDGKTTPQSLLAYMVDTATKRFGADRASAGGGDTPSLYQAVTIASIVEAEADNAEDMGKVARVIRNRLDRGMPLQMDSTINYALGRSTLDTTHEETRTDNPYNTYARKGLPPTPIGNPGETAMKAAISPTPGNWLYFVTVKPGDTRFTSDYDEQRRNVEEFNRNRSQADKDG